MIPVITAIILDDDDREEYEELILAIRKLAKKQIGNDWVFLDTKPVTITIGEVKII